MVKNFSDLPGNPKLLNQNGDYYFCNRCDNWHRYRDDATSFGNKHLDNFDETKTNSISAKYYFCGSCNKWHTDKRKDHLQYRMRIKRDLNMITASIVQPPHAPSPSNSHHSPTAIIGSFDGPVSLWKNENELLNGIPSIAARGSCEGILALVKNLDKDLHVRYFSRRNGFSFIVKGLKIGEIKIGSGGFVLRLIQNILNKGYTSVHQVKRDFVFTGPGKPPVSDADLRNHFVSEAKNLIELRKNNTIGYREKWLHCLLIEKMQDSRLSGLDLEFLYYETPVGKVKRNKQFGREHIDILAKERQNKALVVVEVKKQGEDLNSAVSHGISYIEWLGKYKEKLKPRIDQLGWDVDVDNLKLIVIAPDMDFKNTFIDASISEQAKRLKCKVIFACLNSDWIENEGIYIKETLILE